MLSDPIFPLLSSEPRCKFAIIIPDGAADLPIDALQGQTILQAANIPHLDQLAARGIVGRSFNVPAQYSPGSDVATLSLLGYAPEETYTGRAPLEAAAQGIELGPNDIAFRCNFVHLEDSVMKSFTAGHISSDEAKALIVSLQETIAPRWTELTGYHGSIEFYPGVSYRNLMIWRDTNAPASQGDVQKFSISPEFQTFPPHDFTDQKIDAALPCGPNSQAILKLMNAIEALFKTHPVNQKRLAQGQLPATHAWLWGQGKKPRITPFAQRYHGIRGAMITAVDLLRGIASNLGWEQINVPNITGYIDTDYAAKGRYAAAALDQYDLVCVHVEATDESGHEGDFKKKRQAIERIDADVVAPILAKLQTFPQWRLLVSPDHPTPVALKTHSRGFVPWIVTGSNIAHADESQNYDETAAEKSAVFFEHGSQLMSHFVRTAPSKA